MRVVAVQRRQQRAVVDGERGLDEARDTGGGHGVPDHRLDRPQDGVTVAGSEHLGQGGQFGSVARRRRGAVRFQQTQGAGFGRVEPGGPPRLPHGIRLTARVGVDQPGRPAVAGHPGAPDHGVDPVAVAFGVGQPLEDDDARALADQDAVGVPVEGADALAGGEGAELGEHAPQRDVVAVVDASREHQVAAPGGEFAHRLVHGDQGGRAGRVHGVRGTAQVQPVGDPGGGEIGHQTDRGLGTVRAQPLGERLAHAAQLIGRQIRQQLAQCAHELPGRADPLVEPGQAGVR